MLFFNDAYFKSCKFYIYNLIYIVCTPTIFDILKIKLDQNILFIKKKEVISMRPNKNFVNLIFIIFKNIIENFVDSFEISSTYKL